MSSDGAPDYYDAYDFAAIRCSDGEQAALRRRGVTMMLGHVGSGFAEREWRHR